PLLEMPYGTPADVVLADLVDLQGRHDARHRAAALERILQRKRVDDRGEHAHVVGRDAVHARLGQSRAAEDVAAADDETDLDAHRRNLGDLARDALDDRRIDAVLLAAEQRFAAQLQQDTFIGGRPFAHGLTILCDGTPRLTGPPR